MMQHTRPRFYEDVAREPFPRGGFGLESSAQGGSAGNTPSRLGSRRSGFPGLANAPG